MSGMNGFGLQITGIKMSSPAPAKKQISTPASNKKKQVQTKPTAKKPAVPTANNLMKSPTTQKKQTNKKVQQKSPQQTKTKQQKKQQSPVKKQESKIQEKAKIQQQVKKQQPKIQQAEPVKFQVLLRYNHYKDKFPCINGILSFSIPNQKYCFGLVFKGNYQPLIRNFKTRQIIQPLTTGKADQFTWKVDQHQVYQIQIQQDEQQQSKHQRHGYKAPDKNQPCPLKKNKRVDDLTNQMRNMNVNQLGTDKHKQMLEQRDLQDILFS